MPLPVHVFDQNNFINAYDASFTSLAVIWFGASKLMTYWRRVAGCHRKTNRLAWFGNRLL
jgi:hypothetical protein